MKELDVGIPCSVSQELVDYVVHNNPGRFDTNGRVNIVKVLFELGFKIDNTMKSRGFYRNEDVYIRDNLNPYRAYKTSVVYNGNVRNKLLRYTPEGEPVYSRERHSLYSVYEKYECLQPPNLNVTLPADRWRDVESIGSQKCYDEGFNRSEQPTSSGRNIVRKRK